MKPESIEDALRSHGEAIRRLQPSPQGMAAVLAAPEPRRPRPVTKRRFGALATGFACLLLGGAVATAATGVLNPALDSFFGGGDPPGRQLPAEEVPSWLQPAPDFNAPDEVSVVASAGDEHLYAYRQRNNVCFDYGHHVGECRSPAEWRSELEDQKALFRGPVGRSVWFGLAGPGIAAVRVEYGDGGSTEVAVTDGGFVADLEPERNPQRLVALDDSGAVVAEQPLDD